MKMTVNQLADILGVEYIVASSFVKLLEVKGLANVVGKVKPKNLTGRGKPSTVYEIPKQVTISIHDIDEMPVALDSLEIKESVEYSDVV